MEVADTQRLDKWLWAARFYKTRALATAAIDGGKVHVNGERVKPSRNIKIGDSISVSREQLVMDIGVRSFNAQRRPATEAQKMYEETAASIERRQQQTENNTFLDSMLTRPSGKPSKKDRRKIAKFIGAN